MNKYEYFFIRRTHSFCAVALLIAVSLFGDHLVSINHEKHAFKAIVDNSTHFLIGGISWLIVCINTTFMLNHTGCLFQILLCAVIASVIDVDHFLSAKSLSLKDAINLKQRPFLHCSSVPVVIFSCVFLIGNYLKSVTWKLNALIILVAFSSHHIRDATRRGLWFAPFGSTSVIPYPVYIAFNCVIPFVISFILNCAQVRPTQDQYAYEV